MRGDDIDEDEDQRGIQLFIRPKMELSLVFQLVVYQNKFFAKTPKAETAYFQKPN